MTHTFYPSHLFPSVPPTSTAIPIDHGVFLSGPLPRSSILHLALNHLRYGTRTGDPENDTTKGKSRETSTDGRHVLLLCPDRTGWRDDLISQRDLELLEQDLDSTLVQLLSQIEIKYLPTSAHYTYLLHTLYSHDEGAATQAREAFRSSGGAKSDGDPSYLPKTPTMVILLDPSLYLAEEVHQRDGMEGYGSLVALFFSTFAASAPLLVICDLHASTLELPIIPAHLQKSSLKRKRQRDDSDEEHDDEDHIQRAGLESVAEYFCDWVGKVDRVPGSPTSVLLDGERRFSLTLRGSRRRPTPDGSPRIDRVMDYTIMEETTKTREGTEVVGVRIQMV